MSSRPKCSTQASTIAFTALPSVTSQEWLFKDESFSSVPRSRSGSRSTAKTLAPSAAKRTARARPLPQPGPTEPAPVTIATLPLSLEAIEARRVVDQERLALLLRGRDLGEVVDHHAVVRNLLQVRMRPVGAPDGLRRKLLDQLSREGNRVLPGRRLPGDPLAAAHLHPDVAVLHQPHQRLEGFLVRALRSVDSPDVVDRSEERGALQRRRQLADAGAFRMDLQMPADVRQLACEGDHLADGKAFAEMPHVVKAHAP